MVNVERRFLTFLSESTIFTPVAGTIDDNPA